MKKQKKDKRRQSTQDLLGVKKITDYCISTDAGDLVFYIIKPTNISVLPAGAVSAKIRALQNTLSAQAGVELLAMNSRESFNATCLFYHDRMQEEQNPAIRELLEQDRAFLDENAIDLYFCSDTVPLSAQSSVESAFPHSARQYCIYTPFL